MNRPVDLSSATTEDLRTTIANDHDDIVTFYARAEYSRRTGARRYFAGFASELISYMNPFSQAGYEDATIELADGLWTVEGVRAYLDMGPPDASIYDRAACEYEAGYSLRLAQYLETSLKNRGE